MPVGSRRFVYLLETAGTAAAQEPVGAFDLVALELERAGLGREGDVLDLAAAGADEVAVVLEAEIVARFQPVDREALEEAVVDQVVERVVDRGTGDRWTDVREPAVDLVGGRMATVREDLPEYLDALKGGLDAMLLQHVLGGTLSRPHLGVSSLDRNNLTLEYI